MLPLSSSSDDIPSPRSENAYKHFYLDQQVQAGMLPVQANKIFDEIVSVLTRSADTKVKVNISLDVDFSNGADDATVRAVKENLQTLNMNPGEWS